MSHATALLEELSARGVRVVPAGDKLRLRPAEAIPPDLLERVRAHKQELLAVLGQTARAPADPASPWPVALRGLGLRKVGSFAPCLLCQTGTWTKYAGLPLCLHHARNWTEPRNTPEDRRAMLWMLLDTWAGLDEARWTAADVTALKDQVLSFWTE
jgi:hypothetical protein